MYRIFYDQKFQGESKNFPHSKEKHYIYDTYRHVWAYSYEYKGCLIGTRVVPKVYQVLNLIL